MKKPFFENALQKWQWQQPETFKMISLLYTFVLYIASRFLYQLNQQIPFFGEWNEVSSLRFPCLILKRLVWMEVTRSACAGRVTLSCDCWKGKKKTKTTCLSTGTNLWRSATSLDLGLEEKKTISLNVFLLISVTLLSCGSLKAVRGPSKVRERTEQCPV